MGIRKSISALCIATLLASSSSFAHDLNQGVITTPDEMLNEAQNILGAFDLSKVETDLQSASFGAANSELFKANLEKIKSFSPNNLITAHGDSNIMYDLILQPGHFWRKSGATGTGGKYVYERNIVAFIVNEMAVMLTQSGLNVLVIEADKFNRGGLNAKAFLAIHADGNEKACATAPSMGYDDKSDLLGVHAIGYGLSQALGYSYEGFMRDGFTKALRNYYAFKHVQTQRFEGVLEIGELTCPEEEVLLIENAKTIANNIAVMLQATILVESN